LSWQIPLFGEFGWVLGNGTGSVKRQFKIIFSDFNGL